MLTGGIVTIVTPVGEKDNVYRASLKKLIDYHAASGTSAIVSASTTGGSATSSHDEHADVVMTTLELADGRIPMIAGAGTNATAETISLMQHLNDSGTVGCPTVTPYYNRPSQEGLYQHFKAIVEHTDLPQILYGVSFRTGCDLLPETAGHLAKVENIIGIKEAIGNLTRVSQIKELVSDDFVLLSGDDMGTLDFMQLSGYGAISVTASVTAHDTVWICRLATEGYFVGVRIINRRLMPLHDKLFVEPNPIPMKWARRELGPAVADTLYLPVIPITGSGRETVRTTLKHAGLL